MLRSSPVLIGFWLIGVSVSDLEKREWRVIQKTKTEMGGESNEIQALGKKLGTNNNDCGFMTGKSVFSSFFSFEVNNFILIFPFLLDF